MLTVGGFEVAEGQTDEALVALSTIPLEGAQEAQGVQELSRKNDGGDFSFHRGIGVRCPLLLPLAGRR